MSVCSPAAGQHVQRVTSRPPHTDAWAHLRRIPRDDLFALLLFAMSLILSIPLWFSVHYYYQLGIITCIALAVANVAMNVTIFGSLFLMAEGKNLIAWLRGYWESNVLGIALIVHHCSDGQLRVGLRVRGCKSSRVSDGVIGRYDSVTGQLLDELCLTCGSSTIAVLPLGGWGHRGYLTGLGGKWWRVTISQWTSGELAHLPVQLRDSNGNRCSLILQHALELRHLRSRGFEELPLAFLLSHQALLGERRLLTAATTTIEEAIERIQATSRFGKSKDARAIRVWLQEQLTRIKQGDLDDVASVAAAEATATIES